MRKKIAIFPAGTEIGLEINRALKYSVHFEVFGLASMADHSRCVYKKYTSNIPFYTQANFIDELNEYIETNQIDLIYPAHDDVQLFLTRNASVIKAEIVTSDLQTVEICRSKIETYKYFDKYDFVPLYFEGHDVTFPTTFNFPLFIKPNIGQGSKGAKKVNSDIELQYEINNNLDIVVCEFLPGEEYTIDCFTDYHGDLLVCKMRNRIRTKAGISVNSKILTAKDEVVRIANIINQELKLQGAWFFQVKKDKNNKYKLMEIAPRVSGTMGLTRNTGTNLPLLTIYNKMNYDIRLIHNKYEIEVDRALFSRYIINQKYKEVYLDLDDTLIIENKVNIYIMMFIYQCINKNIDIYLLTKHSKNVLDTLRKYLISPEVFKRIIHISKDEEKSKYISSMNSIFIDDSFSERYSVSEKLGIAVFDSSEVEALIDWRL